MDWIHYFGIKADSIIPAFIGSLVSLMSDRTLSFIEAIFTVFAGVAMANYFTDAASSLVEKYTGIEMLHGMAFLIGFAGYNLAKGSIVLIKKWKEKPYIPSLFGMIKRKFK